MRRGCIQGKITNSFSVTKRPGPTRARPSSRIHLCFLALTPGHLPELYVLDLFAGPGSLGLEALSRGARLCCCVEKDKAALKEKSGRR